MVTFVAESHAWWCNDEGKREWAFCDSDVSWETDLWYIDRPRGSPWFIQHEAETEEEQSDWDIGSCVCPAQDSFDQALNVELARGARFRAVWGGRYKLWLYLDIPVKSLFAWRGLRFSRTERNLRNMRSENERSSKGKQNICRHCARQKRCMN